MWCTPLCRSANSDTTAYLGVGKREEVRLFVSHQAEVAAAADSAGPIEVLLVDHEISPSQARNLEIDVGCEVMDRTMVILGNFPPQRPFARRQRR